MLLVNSTTAQVVPGIIIAKVEEGVNQDDMSQIQRVLVEQFISVERKYPNAKKLEQEFNAQGFPLIDLTRTYRITIDPEADLMFAKRTLEELALFEIKLISDKASFMRLWIALWAIPMWSLESPIHPSTFFMKI
jgi:hypothetical protein